MSKINLLPPEAIAEQAAFRDRVRAWNEEYKEKTGVVKKVFVMTFGCQQNEADSEKIAGMAMSMGYEVTYEAAEADLIMVNTCAIREHAELKALSTIGQYKHLKAKKPDMLIGVCGCMVTQDHRKDDIKFRYPYVDFVLGTSSIHRLPQLIAEKMEKGKRIYCPEETEYLVAEGLPIHRESTYRAWVSIMYGCNNFCSYCIVPYVRGRERSRRKEEIFEEVKSLVADGYRDITLLGQNVNSYGKDNDDGCDFADLLALLSSIEGNYTIHFMTSHPKDATKKLIDVMATHPHIAPHFHLPMQSGSDTILERMNRHYDTTRYLEILDYMREKMPDVAVTSDIIVGFPGETEEDFEATLDMLRRVKFDMLYSFIYSPRKGTPAAEMEDQIPAEVKSARFERLLAVQNEIALKKNLPLVGKTVRVLCDGISKTNDKVYSGRTDGSKIVFFDGCEEDTGRFVNVRITRAEAFALYGDKID
ncbi:MAG: tRNA (N6-isopentenyl adenosine(37)-C2)-methylthiotransferase MiaB [Clostridia bacterium]|nr:tRNA (N6-isopentenyl adenosine(37)-C2)-methylthiotransferase MiaB [Clostridia bacterium]